MKRLILGAMVAAAMLFAPKAEAAIIIDFSGNVTGGTVTDLGGGNWSGTGIIINSMNAINTPLNSGSGQAVSGSNGGYGSLDFNTLTNTISITGYVPSLGMSSAVTLLTGSFSTFSVTLSGPFYSLFATGPDTKDPTLLAALGLPANTPFEFFGFTIAFSNTGTSPYTAFSTDIGNTVVPEPGSMLLLGTGLLGIAALARRRLRSKS